MTLVVMFTQMFKQKCRKIGLTRSKFNLVCVDQRWNLEMLVRITDEAMVVVLMFVHAQTRMSKD